MSAESSGSSQVKDGGTSQPQPGSRQNQPGIVPQKRDPEISADHVSQVDALLDAANRGEKPARDRQSDTDERQAGADRKSAVVEDRTSDRRQASQDVEPERFRPESLFEDDEFYQDEKEASDKRRQKRGKSLNDFAAEREIDAEELLNLVIADEDGEEPMSVKAAQKRLQEVKNFESRRDEFEDFHARATQELMSARGHMAGMIDKIRQLVEPDTMARVFSDTLEERRADVEHNRKLVFEYMPEWRDPTTRNHELEEMDKFFVKMFQFKPGEIRQVTDARLMYAANFMFKLVGRYERSKSEVKKLIGKVPTQAPSKRVNGVDQRQSVRELARSDHEAAVSKILGM